MPICFQLATYLFNPSSFNSLLCADADVNERKANKSSPPVTSPDAMKNECKYFHCLTTYGPCFSLCERRCVSLAAALRFNCIFNQANRIHRWYYQQWSERKQFEVIGKAITSVGFLYVISAKMMYYHKWGENERAKEFCNMLQRVVSARYIDIVI